MMIRSIGRFNDDFLSTRSALTITIRISNSPPGLGSSWEVEVKSYYPDKAIKPTQTELLYLPIEILQEKRSFLKSLELRGVSGGFACLSSIAEGVCIASLAFERWKDLVLSS